MSVAAEPAVARSPASPASRVLVADDDSANRHVLAKILRKAGYEVATAANGREALDAIDRDEFDLVLLDILMPKVDGMQALAAVRSRRSATRLPVVMATAVEDRRTVVRALRSGANDYVTKPFDKDIVLARIAALVDLKRAVETGERAHAAIRRDVAQAAAMQRARLPRKGAAFPGCRAAWAYRACEGLAGDFLNVAAVDERRTALYVVDVCGHGAPAAMMSSAVSWALATGKTNPAERSLVEREPVEIVRTLNERFREAADLGRWFTLAYARYDASTRELTYALAAHPRPLLVTADGEAKTLEGTGCPIGLFPPEDPLCETFSQRTLSLSPGDRLYLFSDGIAEAGNACRRALGEEGIAAVLRESRGVSLQESIDALVAEAEARCGESGFEDDVSVLGLEIEA